MRSGRVVVATLLILAAQRAEADPAAPERPSKAGHFSGFAQLGTGFRGIFPFDEEYCGEDDPSLSYCLGRSPLAFDLGGGYGLTHSLEVILTLSLGLEKDFGAAPGIDGPHLVALAPGLKLYLGAAGSGEMWSTLELPIDLTGYDQADSTDFGIRNRNGFEFPLADQLGGYLYFGETASWRRWFRFELEAGVGVMYRH